MTKVVVLPLCVSFGGDAGHHQTGKTVPFTVTCCESWLIVVSCRLMWPSK